MAIKRASYRSLKRTNPGRGCIPKGRRVVQFSLYTDDEMIEQLAKIAKTNGVSLSEAIRTVLTWGFESIGE